MSINDLKKAMDDSKVLFGVKQALKNSKSSKISAVYVVRDAREETKEKLRKSKIDFLELKDKEDVARELGTDFESEVYSIVK